MAISFAVPAGYAFHFFDEIGSTNSEALRLAATAYGEKHWIVAGRQTQGRGRRGRQWVSMPGNLYASLLLFPEKSLSEIATLSFVAGLAIRQAIVDLAPWAAEKIALKWPNDLLIEGKKVAGILLESSVEREQEYPALVVGFGINCVQSPDDVRYPATNLASAGMDVSPPAIFNRIAIRFDEFYEVWSPVNGFSVIRDLWLKSAAGIGKPITVRFADNQLEGIFDSLDHDGQLILRDSNNKKTAVTAGDIFFSQGCVPENTDNQVR